MEIQLIVPKEKKSSCPLTYIVVVVSTDRTFPGRDTYFLVEFFHFFCPAFRSKVLLKFLGCMLHKVRPHLYYYLTDRNISQQPLSK